MMSDSCVVALPNLLTTTTVLAVYFLCLVLCDLRGCIVVSSKYAYWEEESARTPDVTNVDG